VNKGSKTLEKDLLTEEGRENRTFPLITEMGWAKLYGTRERVALQLAEEPRCKQEEKSNSRGNKGLGKNEPSISLFKKIGKPAKGTQRDNFIWVSKIPNSAQSEGPKDKNQSEGRGDSVSSGKELGGGGRSNAEPQMNTKKPRTIVEMEWCRSGGKIRDLFLNAATFQTAGKRDEETGALK